MNSEISKWPRYAAVAAAAFVLSAGSVALLRPATAQSSLQERVQRLEDENQLRALSEEEPTQMNRGDHDAALALFSDDATWSGRIGTAHGGPAGIKAMWDKFLGHPTPGAKLVKSLFLVTQIQVHVDPDGQHATGTGRWTSLSRTPDNHIVVAIAGHYDNKFVRVNGKWKFSHMGAWRDISSDCTVNGVTQPMPCTDTYQEDAEEK